MIRGTVVNIAGTDYTVPPFTIGQWEAYDAALKAYAAPGDAGVPGMVRAIAPLLVENIRRNYPDFALGADDWDLPTFLEARAACLATSRQANPPSAPSNPSTGAT